MTDVADRGADFWRAQAQRYDRAVGFLNRRFEAMAREVGDAVDGCQDVLEVAAGTGLVTQHIAPRVSKLVATDASDEMLDILRGRIRDLGEKNVAVELADIYELRFDAESFDAVVMANVLHLLPSPDAALHEAKSVLRRGGRLFAPTFCHGDDLVAHAVSRLLALFRFPVITRFSGASLASLIEAAGLVVERRERFAGLLPVWLVVARRP